MLKVLYIISDIDKALSFEWIATYIDKERYALSFILLNAGDSILEQYLCNHNFNVYRINCKGKTDWISATIKTYKAIKKIKPDLVHCHLLQANVIGLTASKMAGVKKRIYTRHHSSLHHVYFKKGILWDMIANKFATHVIAISGIVKEILTKWEHVPENKIILVPHGFLLSEFNDVEIKRVEHFKNRIGINKRYPVIGVISRFTEWKGIQYIIPAFFELCKQYPNAVLLLLNAKGDYEDEIMNQLKALPESTYRLIPFEKDIAAAYKAMDVFVHVPIDNHSEAFGQIYIEALAAGVPAVFTRSGISNDKDFNDENVVIVSYKDSNQILDGIINVLEDKERTANRIKAGKELARQFDLNIYIDQLEKLYSQ